MEQTCQEEEPAQRFELLATTAESAAMSLGALTVQHSGAAVVPYSSSGSCSEDVAVGAVDLTLAAPLAASLGRFRLVVDEQEWSWPMSASGTLAYRAGGEPDERAYWLTDPGAFRLWTLCDELEGRGLSGHVSPLGLPPGKHTVKVRAELIGSPDLVESEPLEVTLACPARVSPGAEDLPGAEAKSSGCSVGPGGRALGGAPLLLGALWVLFACVFFRVRRKR